MIHTAELRENAPRLSDLVQLKVHDRIGEYQRLRSAVHEDELLEDAAGNQRLINLPTPILGRIGIEISCERDIDMPRPCSLPNAGGRPCDGVWKCFRPLPDMCVMELIGGNEVANSPHRLQFACKLVIKGNW